MKKRFISILCALLLFLWLAGCASTSGTSADQATSIDPAAASVSSQPDAEDLERPDEQSPSGDQDEGSPTLEYSFPLDESVTLTYWGNWNPDLSTEVSMKDASVYRTLQEKTNVNMEYYEDSPFNRQENFNLMVASGEWYDLFSQPNNMTAEACIDEGLFIDLTPYLSTYLWHYNELLQSDEAYLKAVRTADGRVATVANEYSPDKYVEYGLVIRQDWLNDLNLETPTTYDDMHQVLTAFKNELGATSGLNLPYTGVLTGNYLVAGYGVAAGVNFATPFYQINGVVHCGVWEEGYKEYLTMMHEWYKEGLVYPDFYSSTDPNSVPTDEVSTDNMGAFTLELNRYHELDGLSADPDFQLWPIADMVKNEGDVNRIRASNEYANAGGYGIATTCKYPEIAMLWFDYRYTDEGIQLCNYGLEGEGFEFDEKGEPKLTELITGASNVNFSLAKYATVAMGYTISSRMYDTYSDAQKAAVEVWATSDDAYLIPGAVTLTPDEQSQISGIYADIETTVTEFSVKVITGENSIDEWDRYIENLKSIGIEQVIAVRQTALDRYNKD